MSQTTVRSLNHCKELLPIDLATVGISGSVKHLSDHGFLIAVVRLSNLPSDLPASTTLEQELAEGYHDERQRHGFLARRRIVRSILAQFTKTDAQEVKVASGAQGQPVIAAPEGLYHISFSAREEVALIGIATRPIGVDIDIFRPDMLLPLNVLRADERATLQALPESARPAAFGTLWTAKEAIVKALHCGFRMPPEAIHIDGWSDGERLTVKELAPLPEGIEPPPGALHLKTWPNLVVAGLTGGLVVGAACIA